MVLVVFFSIGLLVLWLQVFLGYFGSFTWASYGLGDLKFLFLVDEISSVCLLMLFCCGGIALFYCYHYFSGGGEGQLLFPLIVWFLGVMAFLIFSSSLVYSLVFWEYLGIVSFFLILFYSKSASLRASLMTLFASRFGDVSLFMLIMWLGSWLDFSSAVFVGLYLLVILTKSACYPFVSWLLEAMRAPTPVSSLVHSSTLVAAGVWFLFRYDSLGGSLSYSFLVFLSVVTIMMTGVSAILFMDLKKIVALSTCKNVSWCVLFFISGDLNLALLQLLTHGVCKCYLFMSVGDLMSQAGGSQSSVGVYVSRYSGLYLPFMQGLLMLSLCGVPYLGVYFSKHGLLSGLFYGGNVGVGCLYLLCLLLSYVYSVRFALLLMSSCGGLSFGYSSLFLLICPLVFLGSLLNYMWVFTFEESLSVPLYSSVIIVLIQLVGCVVGAYFYYLLMGRGRWASLLWGCESYVSLFYKSFLSFSSLCVVSFYRWEVYITRGWFSLGGSAVFWGGALFTLNVVAYYLLYSFFACLFLAV